MSKATAKDGFTMSRDKVRALCPTKQKLFKKKIFGFDIETYDNNKEFLMASIYSDDFQKFYYSKEELIHDIRTKYIFRNSYIFATNLSFDFFGTFLNQPFFSTLFRGSDLLMAKTYFYHNDFCNSPKMKDNPLKCLVFLDTMNYSKISVETMGNIIGIPKMAKPLFLGKKPKNEEEWNIMRSYNMQDSRISYAFMKFMINSVESLGGTFKNTIASTSLRLFTDKYLTKRYYINSTDIIIDQLKSYYGGRTEAFNRGLIKDYFYYDFNSLYPSIMHDEKFPDPNTMRVNFKNDYKYIRLFEGTSDIDISCPDDIDIPILPVRTSTGKVIFPTGNIRGFYTHIEIREAVKIGYKINCIYKTIYFTDDCSPFKDFIDDLYSIRLIYKKENNPMEYIVKIIMNSLYGKFGQKFLEKDNWVHCSTLSEEELNKYYKVERKDEYMRVTKDSEPSGFCFPIWASYVSAYGRIKLYKEIIKHKPAYVDTDSILIDHEIEQSTELGKLKLEMKIKKGIIVRPKFYALVDKDNKEYVKVKGLGVHLTYLNFEGVLVNKRVDYTKFSKFKEALRRGLIPNQIIPTHKEFSIEDEKRKWPSLFDASKMQNSKPLYYNYKTEDLKLKAKIDDKINKALSKERNKFIQSDLFDIHSVGSDITAEEFIKNEMRGELDE
jgi:hypothetical protein